MCLETPSDFTINKNIGYKIYTKPESRQQLITPKKGIPYWRKLKNDYVLFFGNSYRMGIWYECPREGNLNYYKGPLVYPYGFHIFPTLKEAKDAISSIAETWDNLCIVQVEFDNIVAKGIQWNQRVLVAKKMRLIKRILDVHTCETNSAYSPRIVITFKKAKHESRRPSKTRKHV